MKKIALFLGVFFCLTTSTVLAVRVTALYQADLPVASQSENERNQMSSKALAQVLVKVSGNNQILDNPKIKTYLNSANGLIEEFSYTPTPNQPKPYLLHLNFDAEGINKILRDTGVPIWGQNRPILIVWLEYDIPDHPPEIMSADSTNPVRMLFKQNVDNRGIPIIFPTMDVEDLSQVSVNDVATVNTLKLTNAAKRYGSDAMLVGHISSDAKGYNTQWRLIMGQDQWGWNITGKILPDIFVAMTDRIAETLAGRYATVIANTVQSTLTLRITHISEPDDFAEVMNYIKHLTPVSDVQLMQIAEGDMILQVNLRGTQESFVQAISIGQKLTPVTENNKPTMLVYQWNH